MTITVIADSLDAAAPLILQGLRDYQCCSVQVFIEPESQGYWAQLKQCSTPTDEMTAAQIKRAMRVYRNPQSYDVEMVPWGAFMYRGLSGGSKSSAF